MPDIVIREAKRSDFVPLMDLWKLVESGSAITDTVPYLEMFSERVPDLFLVAENDGKLVGGVLGGWDLWRGHIYRLAVLPDYQRQGIATRLLSEIEQRLRARGARRIYALIGSRLAALSFWASSGFEQTSDTAFVHTFSD